jgi:ATP-dependent Clp protease protease subunit
MNKKCWEFKAAAGGKSGELLLYGPISNISWFGDELTPKQFAEDLKALGDITDLTIYINSEGGDVWAGQAIHSMLKRHSAKKTVYVDGLAASIASVVAMAGDTIIMPRNSLMMVHAPWTFAAGNAAEFRKWADDLDKAAETIIAVYEAKTGLPREEIIALLDAETWMTAEEAVEKGFADEVAAEKKIAASLCDGKFIVNGREVDIAGFKRFPVDKIPTAALEPAGDKQAAERETQVCLAALRQRVRVHRH